MFAPDNAFAFVIRLVVFVQMLTVFPMVLYITRCQFFGFFYGDVFPSRRRVYAYSLATCGLTTIVASSYPQVGSIAGYTGAFCGLYFMYIIPVLFHLKFSKPHGRLMI